MRTDIYIQTDHLHDGTGFRSVAEFKFDFEIINYLSEDLNLILTKSYLHPTNERLHSV